MATYSSILAWKFPWTEEPGGLQSRGVAKSQTRLSMLTHTSLNPQPFSLLFFFFICCIFIFTQFKKSFFLFVPAT